MLEFSFIHFILDFVIVDSIITGYELFTSFIYCWCFQSLSHVWLCDLTRLPCPSPAPGAYSNSCRSRRWCHATITSSVVPFSSHLQSFPPSGSFQMSQFFTSGEPKYWSFSFNISPSSEYSGLISFRMDWLDLLAGFSRVFLNTTVQKHQFFGVQLSL